MTEQNMKRKEIYLEFDAVSENESLARVVVAAFVTQLNPTIEEIQDVKTAVSEAVTNAIIHAYEEKGGKIILRAALENGVLELEIEDKGIGIENIKEAMKPLFTTKPDKERSGMGFAFMEAFMDRVEVESSIGKGTCVRMRKAFQDKVLMQAAIWNTTQV